MIKEIYITIAVLLLAMICSFLVYIRGKNHPRMRWFYRGITICLLIFCGTLPIIVLQKLHEKANAPLIAHELYNIKEDGMVMQSSGYSCSPATLANVLAHYGIHKTEKDLAYLIKTTRFGTTDQNTIKGMAEINFDCKLMERSIDEMLKMEMPLVLFIYHPITGPQTHTVSCWGQTFKGIEIWDPLDGKRFLSKDELEDLWQGQMMTCRPK